MSLRDACDGIAGITDQTSLSVINQLSSTCEKYLGSSTEIIDAIENTLSIASGKQSLMLWILIDRLAKQHSIFLNALRPKILNLALSYYPRSSSEYQEFQLLLSHSFSVLFGSPLIEMIEMRLNEMHAGGEAKGTLPADATRSQRTLTVHRNALQSIGGFTTTSAQLDRHENTKHLLQVKTLDSQMAMNIASRYAPAQPVEIIVPNYQPDADAPKGHMKAVPADDTKVYEEERRKRLREIMEKNPEEERARQEQRLLERVRMKSQSEEEKKSLRDGVRRDEDIQMPAEFPRENGVRIGNFPAGVRFLRNAIRDCYGAVELEVLSHRVATLSSRDVRENFGDLRRFLSIHSPTFRLQPEVCASDPSRREVIVRLVDATSGDEPTWESMACPHCTKVVKGRNFARHQNSRKCITAQIALGQLGNFMHRGPIAELAHISKKIVNERDSFDDGDVDSFTECLKQAAEVRRLRLASTRRFAPILEAIYAIRERWLLRKGVEEIDDAVVSVDDFSIAKLFSILGRSIHRLPIAWIEMGDIVDMCHRFSKLVLPPFNPPPRPADPRISLDNEYPGFLLCESELDDDDDISDDEDAFSDEDAPTYTFAPPVDVAESLFTAGFERDTKRLQHRMRTEPPIILNRVLKGDRSQTIHEMYADSHPASHQTLSVGRRL